MSTIAVVGAGLAGLNAAQYLAADHDVRVLEASDSIGGRVRTRHRDGFTLDRGFQVLFSAYPALGRDLDLDALNLRAFTPGAVLARPGRRSVVADPLRAPATTIETLRNGEIPLSDALRLLRIRFALHGREPDGLLTDHQCSIETYLKRKGVSERFIENVARPFYGGITLDRSLSGAAELFEYTFAMLSSGTIALPAAGMGAIPAQLDRRARAAGATIETGLEVDGLRNSVDEDGVTIETATETLEADAAVVATDPVSARELTGIESIPTTAKGCTTQYFALERERPLGRRRLLVLNLDGEIPNQVAPLSAVAPEYAPAGRALVSATTIGVPSLNDTELARATAETVTSWYPELEPADLTLVQTDRIPFAQFAQPPGFRDTLPSPQAPAGPVVLAGEYTRWSSIQGALESGYRAAECVSEIEL